MENIKDKEKEIVYVNRGWVGINPTVSEFLKQHPDSTMMGLAWSLGWRLYLIILGLAIGLAIIGEMFS